VYCMSVLVCVCLLCFSYCAVEFMNVLGHLVVSSMHIYIYVGHVAAVVACDFNRMCDTIHMPSFASHQLVLVSHGLACITHCIDFG
jgi:hypothetical protein